MPGTATNVLAGPGVLYAAPLGTAEPTDATTALPAAWRDLGYTEDGNEFSSTINSEPITVAEEVDPIRYDTVSRESSITFAMAEVTRANLALALNIGANAANDATALEPVAPGAEVRVMLIHQSANGARHLYRRCFQAGTTSIASRKAPQKKLIAVTFRLEKPTGLQPFKVFPAAGGLL
jgi:hypothetical protein